MHFCTLGCCSYHRLVGADVAVADVVLNRVVEEGNVLWDNTNVSSQAFEGDFSGVIGLDRYWMDWIRMDFGWIGSAWWTLLDGLDEPSQIQLDPIAEKGNLCMPISPSK
jgi:hypothetical protein